MLGRVVDAEDYRTGRQTKLITLKADRNGEKTLFKLIRDSNERFVRVTFDPATGELRIVLPEGVVEALRRV